MARFSSIEHAPAETRRILRDRMQRFLGAETSHLRRISDEGLLADETVLALLEAVEVTFAADWTCMLEAYQAAQSSEEEQPTLQSLVARGWARVVWDRVQIAHEANRALRSTDNPGMDAFKRILKDRFAVRSGLVRDVALEGEIASLAKQLEAGELTIDGLKCRSPSWVAARLWDQALAPDSPKDDRIKLRIWRDKWNALGSPPIVPSHCWGEVELTRFHEAAFAILENEPALEGWRESRARWMRELAVAHDQNPEDYQNFLTAPPETLVERAVWMEGPSVERVAQDSWDSSSSLLGLVRLLVADIEAAPFSAAPNPLAARLFHLLQSRPDVFFNFLFSIRWHARLVADLVMYPPTCALACYMISQWQGTSGAYDRDLLSQSDLHDKSAAFEDAVSILSWWLDKGLAQPSETASLLAALHRHSKPGFIDDLSGQEGIRTALHDVLLSTSTSTLAEMVACLCPGNEPVDPGSRLAAALELVAAGGLASYVDPGQVIASYVGAISASHFSLSVHRLGLAESAALFEVAQRDPGLHEKFLFPIDVQARLKTVDEPNANSFIIESDLARSIRAHVRVLCRLTAKRGTALPDDIHEALVKYVRSGALSHKEKGKLSAFAPRHEASMGSTRDRPIAKDLAAALKALSGERRQKLLAAILETDEPMVLAQLLPIAPWESRGEIDRRISTLSPTDAGVTYSLPEVQSRIDELLSAGAVSAAAKFIEEEQRLQTLGRVQGREITRFRSELRLLFAKREWDKILSTQLPADLNSMEKQAAGEILEFHKGLALISQPGAPGPAAAETIFEALYRRHPRVGTYNVNRLAARIATLLGGNLFSRLDGEAAREGRKILVETRGLIASPANLTQPDQQVLHANHAILNLALDLPEDALAALSSPMLGYADERMQVYRAVALARLGHPRQAMSALKTAEDDFGKTELLQAAWAQIQEGKPFAGNVRILTNDDPVVRVREGYRDLHLLDPIQQAAVVHLGNDPFSEFVIEQVRGAAASIIALVPMMEVAGLDSCEDSITAVIRELLLSRLGFLRWSVPDQSKGGYSPKGNPGERDLMIMRDTTVLAVIEAVICSSPAHWQTVQANLSGHFQKLVGYATCRLFFHVTYVSGQAVQAVIDRLKQLAADDAPVGFSYTGSTEISPTDSRPYGFIAHYKIAEGEIKVVFLALDVGQEKQMAAAAGAAR